MLFYLAAMMLSGCAAKSTVDSDVATRNVTLPDGTVIKAELKITPQEQQIGMMYRMSIAHDRGMLFIYTQPQQYPYWMKNCNFPLDIIFIGADHRVVEVAENAPPCPAGETNCPTFGGHVPAQFVLEINGGDAAKHGVTTGAMLSF